MSAFDESLVIQAQGVRGLDRVVDYSRFSIFAMLGEGLFWILAKLHGLIGNWGWSIIGLVLLVKQCESIMCTA